MLLERGVVDQDVEPPQLAHGLCDRAFTEFRTRHVAGNRDAAPPFVLNAGTGFFRVGMFVEIDDRNVRTFACEQHRHRTADPGIATR